MHKRLSFVLLSAVVLAHCPGPKQVGDRICHTTCGEDRPGGDYADHHVGSLEACILLCGHQSECKAAAYHEETGYCYLKNSVNPAVLDFGNAVVLCRTSPSGVSSSSMTLAPSCHAKTITLTETTTEIKTIVTTEIQNLISTVVSDLTVTVFPSTPSSSAKSSGSESVSTVTRSTLSTSTMTTSPTTSAIKPECTNGYNYDPMDQYGDPWIGICGVGYLSGYGQGSISGVQSLTACIGAMIGGVTAVTWNATSLECTGWIEIDGTFTNGPELQSAVDNGVDGLSPNSKFKRSIDEPDLAVHTSRSFTRPANNGNHILQADTLDASSDDCVNGGLYVPNYQWVEICQASLGSEVVATTTTNNLTACIDFAAFPSLGLDGLSVSWNRTSGECTSFNDAATYTGQYADIDSAVVINVSESFNGK